MLSYPLVARAPIQEMRHSPITIFMVIVLLVAVMGSSFYAGYTDYSDTYYVAQQEELRALLYAGR